MLGIKVFTGAKAHSVEVLGLSMSAGSRKQLHLESLATGIPVIPEEAVGFYKHNCMVCLDSQNHHSGVKLKVFHSDSYREFGICWNGEVTDELRRAYADLVRATDNAACAIALLIIREITEMTAVEQAIRGTTIDYYLSHKMQEDELIFNYAARLEVSGILRENESNTVNGRVKEKINRLKPGLCTYVIVVEFSNPMSKVVKV